jgi:hypothetical protein
MAGTDLWVNILQKLGRGYDKALWIERLKQSINCWFLGPQKVDRNHSFSKTGDNALSLVHFDANPGSPSLTSLQGV